MQYCSNIYKWFCCSIFIETEANIVSKITLGYNPKNKVKKIKGSVIPISR